jgi:hypothetical protein
MSLTLAQRREILASMSWVAVSPIDFQQRCEGHVVDMPLYARKHMTKEEKREHYGCKNRARWVFLSLNGEIKIFCWWHLFIEGFESSAQEFERYNAWVDQYTKSHPVPPDWRDEEPDEPLGRS